MNSYMDLHMDYSTFLDRMKRMRLAYRHISRITQLDVPTVARYIQGGKRLPGEAIFAIADELQLTGAEVAEELLGIKPRREEGTVTYSEIVDVILRAAEEAKR